MKGHHCTGGGPLPQVSGRDPTGRPEVGAGDPPTSQASDRDPLGPEVRGRGLGASRVREKTYGI